MLINIHCLYVYAFIKHLNHSKSIIYHIITLYPHTFDGHNPPLVKTHFFMKQNIMFSQVFHVFGYVILFIH